MNQMIKVRLITDILKEPYISNKNIQLEKFNSIELPMYVILTPDEKLIDKKPYTPNEKEFVEFLKKGLK
jgi:hypothetical protein